MKKGKGRVSRLTILAISYLTFSDGASIFQAAGNPLSTTLKSAPGKYEFSIKT
jgi:hypothetical protein